jgi:hypothetical protein
MQTTINEKALYLQHRLAALEEPQDLLFVSELQPRSQHVTNLLKGCRWLWIRARRSIRHNEVCNSHFTELL